VINIIMWIRDVTKILANNDDGRTGNEEKTD
jgi:hypothetical protein